MGEMVRTVEKFPKGPTLVSSNVACWRILHVYRWFSGFKHGFYFPFHIWDVIPTPLTNSYFSRWLLYQQPDLVRGFSLASHDSRMVRSWENLWSHDQCQASPMVPTSILSYCKRFCAWKRTRAYLALFWWYCAPLLLFSLCLQRSNLMVDPNLRNILRCLHVISSDIPCFCLGFASPCNWNTKLIRKHTLY